MTMAQERVLDRRRRGQRFGADRRRGQRRDWVTAPAPTPTLALAPAAERRLVAERRDQTRRGRRDRRGVDGRTGGSALAAGTPAALAPCPNCGMSTRQLLTLPSRPRLVLQSECPTCAAHLAPASIKATSLESLPAGRGAFDRVLFVVAVTALLLALFPAVGL